LPSTKLKQERKLLPPPKQGAYRSEIRASKPINMPSRKAIELCRWI